MGNASTANRTSLVRVLIIGNSQLTGQLIEILGSDARYGYDVVGVVAEESCRDELTRGYPILGTLADFDRILGRVRPDLIVVAPAERRGGLPIRRLLELRFKQEVEIEDGAEFYERLTGSVALELLAPTSLLFSRSFMPSGWYLRFGRALGVVVALAAIVCLAPLFLLIMIAIRLDSPGPFFFVQQRAGTFGRPFLLFKFRTMRPSSGQRAEWEGDNGDRITRVGRWLRKFRLDELPNIFNIVRGDMNFVGPRPHPWTISQMLNDDALHLNSQSAIDAPYYTLRCLVRPGITGWAQVRYGYANNLEEELAKLRYDLFYVKHASLRLDLRILAETVLVVLHGHNGAEARTAQHTRFVPKESWTLARRIGQARTA